VVSQDLRAALDGRDCPLSTVVAGLGGRPVTRPSLRRLITQAGSAPDGPTAVPPPLEFLDLDRELLVRGASVAARSAAERDERSLRNER
jgi:pyruvate ferredoxin oxidoreductase alpha subunit